LCNTYPGRAHLVIYIYIKKRGEKRKEKRKLTLLTSMYLYHFPSARDKLCITVLQSKRHIIPKYYLSFTVQEWGNMQSYSAATSVSAFTIYYCIYILELQTAPFLYHNYKWTVYRQHPLTNVHSMNNVQ